MKVTIHQPQYLPWLPYFMKIDECDLFVVLDTVDFQKNGLQNRNQIKTGQGHLWLTVPVQQSLGQKIIDTRTDNRSDWATKHWKTIAQSYAKAAAFGDYEAQLSKLYSETWENLCAVNLALLSHMMDWLDIRTSIVRSSEIAASGSSSDLILSICKSVGAKTYLSGTGGTAYLKLEDFDRAGIAVDFHTPSPVSAYPQTFPKVGYLPNLSAIDIILNCGRDWRRYLV